LIHRSEDGFDPQALETAELWIYNVCRELAKAPLVERSESPIHFVQSATGVSPYDAIESLKAYLEAAGVAQSSDWIVNCRRLRELRELCGKTQSDLAAAVNLKTQAVSHLERKAKRPKLSRMILVAEALAVSLPQVLTGLDPSAEKPSFMGTAPSKKLRPAS